MFCHREGNSHVHKKFGGGDLLSAIVFLLEAGVLLSSPSPPPWPSLTLTVSRSQFTQYVIRRSVAVLLFGQSRKLWRPLFDAPWRGTSLAEVWGRQDRVT